ncbi:MAG: TolC family protein [Thermoanaerobaculum sp.]
MTKVALVVLAVSPLAMAQEPRPTSEEKAVELALAASNRVREAQAAVASRQAQVQALTSGRKLQIVLTAQATQRSSVPEFRLPAALGDRLLFPSLESTATVSGNLAYNLDLAGVVRQSLAAARERTTATEAQLQQVRLEVALEARLAFWQAAQALAFVAVAERELARCEQTLTDTQALLEAGLATEADLLTARAERERARVGVLAARSEAGLRLAALRSLLGLSEANEVRVQPADGLPPSPPPLSELLPQAKENRPELAALRHLVDASEGESRAVKATERPAVSLAVQYDWANPNPRYVPLEPHWHGSWQAAIVAAWKLYDGGEAAAKARAAAAEAEVSRARLAEVQRLVELEVEKAQKRLGNALAVAHASQAAYQAALARENAVRESYSAGIARLADLLAAQEALARAEFQAENSRIEAWIAHAQLLRSIGQ